jgi:hypothetical protein
LKVARWPHGCRRQCSEVAVPALVGSNPTEGGGFFRRKGTSAGPWMCVCVYVYQGLTVGWWKEERHSSDTTARSAGFESQAGWASHDVVCCCIRVVSSRKRRRERVGVGSRESTPEPRRTTRKMRKTSRP